jgi:hypothetical protein
MSSAHTEDERGDFPPAVLVVNQSVGGDSGQKGSVRQTSVVVREAEPSNSCSLTITGVSII